jgi:KaiC/GvpD/RAD55 family RecA-like ATPase
LSDLTDKEILEAIKFLKKKRKRELIEEDKEKTVSDLTEQDVETIDELRAERKRIVRESLNTLRNSNSSLAKRKAFRILRRR